MARKNPLPAQPLRVTSKGGNAEERNGESVIDLRIENLTAFRAPLEDLELRYWLNLDSSTATDGPSARYALSLDWASVSDVNLQLAPADVAGQAHYVKVTFGPRSGMMPREGKLELKIRLKRLDHQPILQSDDYSYTAGDAHSLNDRIALYLWGEQVWGVEPGTTAGG
ncbi:MAG: hypothetical protein M1401_11915 [Chloroflexi bacterium]|nr:hypothetical protein [Chloroflexota bacterium]